MKNKTVDPEVVRRSYDGIAREYAANLADELKGKPLDRDWLTRFAVRLRSAGPVCDLGCGPGHVAGFLHAAGADVFGLDLSSAMVQEARRLNPQLTFREGNMLALEIEDDALAGIVAFYCIVNLHPKDVEQALREMARVLRPDGVLLLAFHVGDECLHRDELWGRPVDLDFQFFRTSDIQRMLLSAGFEIEEAVEREPYPDVEHSSRRAYILATRVTAA
jgi:SAM-dependent methyltransferase